MFFSNRGIKSIGQTSKKIFVRTAAGGTKVDKYFTNRGTKVDRAHKVRLCQVRLG